MKDNADTVAAIGVLAMITTTVSHEVVGHGAACLAIGGNVVHVSSTLFACSAPNSWVAAGGPFFNVLAGLIAAALAFPLPMSRTGLRLLLASVAAFSLFWETGYLVKAMLFNDGDLYFFLRAYLGQYGVWPLIGAAVGGALYLAAVVLVRRLMAEVMGERARVAGRIVWLAATMGAVAAALVFKGDLGPTVRDAALEIGLAGLPLALLMPQGSGEPPAIARNLALAAFSACILAAFAATLGHGLGTF